MQILVHLARRVEAGALRATPDAAHDGAPWRPILIVAPLILVENETWQKEMREFFAHDGELFEPVLVLHGAGIDRVRYDGGRAGRGQETVLGRPLLDAGKLMQYRTVITNYETVVSCQHSLAQLKDGRPLWSAIVTDEAQKYKVPNTKVSHALKAVAGDFHIASTGTPVENRLLDLWNIVDTVQPALLGTASEFSGAYERPFSTEQAGDALAALRGRLLFGEPHAFLVRRTKAELLDLPPKHEVIVPCEMSPAERTAHQELLAALAQGRRAGRHLAALHRLGALYQHPALLRGSTDALTPAELLHESSKLRSVVATLREIQQRGEKALVFARLLELQQLLARVFEDEFGGVRCASSTGRRAAVRATPARARRRGARKTPGNACSTSSARAPASGSLFCRRTWPGSA